jgi:ABC-type transporter Mla subunit MlaD
MTPEQIEELNRARESLVQRRSDIARLVAGSSRVSVENAEELTKIQQAIEAVDRALTDSGQPYLDRGLAARS